MKNNPVNGIDPSGHCGIFDPLGCASDVVGGVGNEVADFAGGVGNALNDPGKTIADTVKYVDDHKATVIFAATMTACAAGVANPGTVAFVAAACTAYLIGGGAGAGGYAAVTVVSNALGGKDLMDGFDPDKAASAGLAGGATAVGCMESAGAMCVTAGSVSSAIQYGYDTGTTPTQDPLGWSFSAMAGVSLPGSGARPFRT